jgi:hypothetical protein
MNHLYNSIQVFTNFSFKYGTVVSDVIHQLRAPFVYIYLGMRKVIIRIVSIRMMQACVFFVDTMNPESA